MESINDGAARDVIENFITEQIANGRDGEESVVDDADHLFIKYSVDGDRVNVYLVEPYEP